LLQKEKRKGTKLQPALDGRNKKREKGYLRERRRARNRGEKRRKETSLRTTPP
jgi:hypothetical protein